MRLRGADQGSAVIEFVLVAPLITLLFVTVVQLALAVHVRSTLVDCAAEGARAAALAGGAGASGVLRTQELISADLSPAYAGDVSARRQVVDGVDTAVVRVRAPMPVIGLLGAGRVIVVEGHAVVEGPVGSVGAGP